ncbi:MAG: amino acid ABC transporter substrate-binding protein [Candidatus Rokubacteria bacterium]|nr:amino acid ABC transporter substrate-binding protein [Candidatus Rokubacteria bacterium]
MRTRRWQRIGGTGRGFTRGGQAAWLAGLAAAVALAAGAGPVAAQKPITIGAPIALTGNLADSAAHVRRGYDLWLEEVNGRGGLLGRPVQFQIYDDRSDAATAARLTERLITSDKVDLLISPFGTAGTSTASAVSEKHKMVMINAGGASESIHQRGFKYIFQVVTPVPYYVEGVFPLAAKAGYKSLVFVSRDYAAARDMEKAIRNWAPQHGIEIRMVEYFPAATTDFASYIARARDIKPDIWVSVGYPPEAIEMIRQMKATNYLPKMFVHNGVSQEDFLKATGKDAEYAFGMSLYEPSLPTKGNPEFVKRFKAKYNYEPGYYALLGYAGCLILEEAVRKTGSLDQDKLAATLRALQTETPFGPYAVNETGAQTAKKGLIVQVLKGHREIVWPFNQKTADAVLPMPPWTSR